MDPPQEELKSRVFEAAAALPRIRRFASLISSKELEPDDQLPFQPPADEERPKTRRVNPQRLALRLGPDLVAEMEALIVPGAKMPTFAVRKDFQDRYCVDRRHIYDYFHSRGLRVAKEDKHTNLKRRRVVKNEQAQQSTLPTAGLSTENPFQNHPGQTLPLVFSAESIHESHSPAGQPPQRAATYPGYTFNKRAKNAIPVENASPKPNPPSTAPPSRVDAVSASSSETESSNSSTHSQSEILDATEVDSHGQLSDGSSLSVIESIHGSRHEDFVPSLGSSWALDQCSNLYDLLDGEYSHVHNDSHLTGPYQAQGTLYRSPGDSFSDLDLHLLGEDAFEGSVKTAGYCDDTVIDGVTAWTVELPKRF
ncbi:hypothetical protein NP233_g1244 [Leucocoprinus birnbaumii]|uniref:Uncharacterized protein n=1 Tax=Leucocoprinus birnbaumii TaxID=56174 RepID=A0AAD5W0A6_9AGAR|nr:hypothetical protein NP233_g1244 [Leucocoprinus birnbaumii]